LSFGFHASAGTARGGTEVVPPREELLLPPNMLCSTDMAVPDRRYSDGIRRRFDPGWKPRPTAPFMPLISSIKSLEAVTMTEDVRKSAVATP